jgi:virulence-associated protein VagC
MADSTVVTNNRTQAVRLPAELRFPDTVKKVSVRAVGVERIVAPIDATWDRRQRSAHCRACAQRRAHAGQQHAA